MILHVKIWYLNSAKFRKEHSMKIKCSVQGFNLGILLEIFIDIMGWELAQKNHLSGFQWISME